MRPSTLRWPILFVAALFLACGTPRTATAGLISSEASTFVSEFRAFVPDFSRWDAAHQDMPLMLLGLTPEQQRPEMLFLLWYLWMHDHPSTAAATFNFPQLLSMTEIYQPTVSGTLGVSNGTGNGGGTIASNSGSSDGSGKTSGSGAGSAPEPSALALAACGSLGLIAYRFVRSRAGRRR